MQLNEFEQQLTKQQLVFHWLKEGVIDFTDIAVAYVEFLRDKRKEQLDIISGLSVPLIQYWESCHLKPKKQDVFMRGKAAFYLLKSKMFRTAPIEEDLEKCVKESGYKE